VSDLAGVVLAAGAGTRLRPLTDLRPKPLCPVGNVTLVDRAMARIAPYAPDIAVNVHHHAGQMAEHLSGRAHISLEQPAALGTAGALGQLRPWIDGRDVLLTNSDAYLGGSLEALVDGWTGRSPRLLVVEVPGQGDFGNDRYVGACLLPWRETEKLLPVASGLYEVMWRALWHTIDDGGERGLDLVRHSDVAIDCGTPGDYLRANLHASGGESVVGEGAMVEGQLVRSVVWPGARVAAHERLVEQVRADDGMTVDARLRR
jgi:MurNAc alpha-1-phosphate uridylyltransferase